MTTSQSPLRVLKAQADYIAKSIKMAERGESVSADIAARIAEARSRQVLVVGVAMDDKIIKLTLPWAELCAASEVALAALILKRMREERGH